MKTSADEVLEAFLRANTAKEDVTDEENEINLLVMEEFANRQAARGEAPQTEVSERINK